MINQTKKELEKVYLEDNLSISKLDSIITQLSNRYGIETATILQLINNRREYLSIPAGILSSDLSPLENVVLYLKLKFGLTQNKIAKILNRDNTTIWTTMDKAKRKITLNEYGKFIDSFDKNKTILIPIHIIAERKLSILESVSLYIMSKYNLSYHEIALMLGKDDRTIWTVINRARRKNR